MRCLCISRWWFASVAVLFALGAGCGSGEDGPLTVSAASSLTEAFDVYGEALPSQPRFSFGGSGELAAQIRQGARPDVFASANTRYPRELAADGLVEDPVVFARNRLIIAVAPGSGVASLDDLSGPGVDLVLCAAGTPCGEYARRLVARLPTPQREAILANVRAEEANVKGVVGKVAQGAADAGIVYASDTAAAAGRVDTVEIPAALGPNVAYSAAVVAGARNPEAAREFIDGLLDGDGAEALAAAGFLPPP